LTESTSPDYSINGDFFSCKGYNIIIPPYATINFVVTYTVYSLNWYLLKSQIFATSQLSLHGLNGEKLTLISSNIIIFGTWKFTEFTGVLSYNNSTAEYKTVYLKGAVINPITFTANSTPTSSSLSYLYMMHRR